MCGVHVSGQVAFCRLIQAPNPSPVTLEVISKEQAHRDFNSVAYDMCLLPASVSKDSPCGLRLGSENMTMQWEFLPVDNWRFCERETQIFSRFMHVQIRPQ